MFLYIEQWGSEIKNIFMVRRGKGCKTIDYGERGFRGC